MISESQIIYREEKESALTSKEVDQNFAAIVQDLQTLEKSINDIKNDLSAKNQSPQSQDQPITQSLETWQKEFELWKESTVQFIKKSLSQKPQVVEEKKSEPSSIVQVSCQPNLPENPQAGMMWGQVTTQGVVLKFFNGRDWIQCV